jgi:DNA-binding NarL/FixJ family response regulator
MAAPVRILIVDDNVDMLEIVKHMLQSADESYQIITATAAEEARKLVQEAPVDLVITDYKMEGASGVNLAEEVHALAPETKVVVMTAFANVDVRLEARRAGVDYFLAKPFSPDMIRRIVRDVLSTPAEQPATAGQEPLSPRQTAQIQSTLNALRASTGATCILLITTTGQCIAVDSGDSSIDAAALASLVAANFAAAVNIASLLGNTYSFEVIHYDSSEQNVCAYRVSDDFLLTTVFGRGTRQGIVQFYTKQAIADLLDLLSPPAQE